MIDDKVIRKRDGFENEKMLVIPTELIKSYQSHPLVAPLYITDIGFFPKAKYHYRERCNGAEEYILLVCIAGKGTVKIEATQFDLSQGHIIIIPPNKPHKYFSGPDDPWDLLWMHFKGDKVQYFINDDNINYMQLTVTQMREIDWLYTAIFEVIDTIFSLDTVILVSQQLSTLLATLIYKFKKDQQNEDKMMYQLNLSLEYMMKNIHQSIGLDELVQNARISRSGLNMVFKKKTGYSPLIFFNKLKMYRICKELRISDIRINEVARRYGYQDPYYFSRSFKKIVGVSPQTFKQKKIDFANPLNFL